MKIIERTTQFKKDIKKYVTSKDKMQKLYDVIVMLENEQTLPQKIRPHKLHGSYAGCMECHIENDLLLIWVDKSTNVIRLLRFGTHSELFK